MDPIRWLGELGRRLPAIFHARRLDRELGEEMRLHRELREKRQAEAGAPVEEARYAARRRFGNELQLRERSRETWGWRWLEDLLQDLRYSARMLRKSPGFALTAVLTLGLGIGANTAIFSFVYNVLLKPLPYRDADRVLFITERTPAGEGMSVAYPNFDDWRREARSFDEIAAERLSRANLTGIGDAESVRLRLVTWNYYQMLGVEPVLGRNFSAADDRRDAAPVVLVGNAAWKKFFGVDPGVAGRHVTLNDRDYTIIGVLPNTFEVIARADFSTPLEAFIPSLKQLLGRANHMGLHMVARLRAGVTVQQAGAEMDSLATQLAARYPRTNSGNGAKTRLLKNYVVADSRDALLVLLGAVALLLLIACVNIASLLLARAVTRSRELSIRFALGASRVRVIRQMLVESLLISALGTAVGVLLGASSLAALHGMVPTDMPRLESVRVNGPVLLFTLGVACLTTMLCGLIPALQASRTDPQKGLRTGGRTSVDGADRQTARNILLVAELAFSMVLLIGAGLMLRTLSKLTRANPGFQTDRLLSMNFSLDDPRYDFPHRRQFFLQVLERVQTIPGARSAAFTDSLPIEGSDWDSVFTVVDQPMPERSQLPTASMMPVTPGYFHTMGIPLLRGRLFDERDNGDPAATNVAASVAIINQKMALRFWPGQDPLGKRIRLGFPESGFPPSEIIGVVGDVALSGVDEATPLEVYFPLAQLPTNGAYLVVRTAGDPLQMAQTVTAAVHSIDKNIPARNIRSMDQVLSAAGLQRRSTGALISVFAGLALLLAVIGIYGVVSYGVAQRSREIGLRMALGAQRSQVLHMVLSQGLWLTVAGVVAGLVGALAVTRLMRSLLFAVAPTDPVALAAGSLVLAVVALVACYVPAWRATRIDPMTALRYE